MKNLKGIAVVTDGNTKRIAITYDVINDKGEATSVNKRINRVVTDINVLEAVKSCEAYEQKIMYEQK